MKFEVAEKLIKDIKWQSTDKDNMEYQAYATYSQKEAIEYILELAWRYNDLANS